MLEIITREMWGAKDALAEVVTKYPFKHVFWISNKTPTCLSKQDCANSLRDIQHFHMEEQKQRDIRYNFLVGGDGGLYECRGWWTIGMLPYRYAALQNVSLIIGFIGDHTAKTLPKHMMLAAHKLIQHGVKMKYIHEQYKNHDVMEKFYRSDEAVTL